MLLNHRLTVSSEQILNVTLMGITLLKRTYMWHSDVL